MAVFILFYASVELTSLFISIFSLYLTSPHPNPANNDTYTIDDICAQLTEFHISDSGIDFSHSFEQNSHDSTQHSFAPTNTTGDSFAILSNTMPNISEIDTDSESDYNPDSVPSFHSNSSSSSYSNTLSQTQLNRWEWRESSDNSSNF